METATLAVKVTKEFAKRYRDFCEAHSLQVGRFTERVLSEMMEDYHFGRKAQQVLGETSGQTVTHEAAFPKPARRRR